MLEDGDEECIELWKKFRELSLLEFEKLYKDLGVKFDSYDGEAFFLIRRMQLFVNLRIKIY